MRAASRFAWLVLLLTACRPAPFELSVTFVGPVELEPGAEVRYQGVRVGKVTAVSLRQDAPDRPGLVELGIAIEDLSITLREDDLFEITTDGLLGDDFVRVTPASETSRPLESGETVAGLAPFVTRVRDSAASALDSLGGLVRDQSEALRQALAGSEEEEAPPEASPP